MQNSGMTYENYKTWVRTRILSRSVKRDSGCIEYQGNFGHKYGLISITIDGNRKSIPAHRALWMAVHGRFDLPGSIQIRHKCDNPRCVNEAHLIDGTAKDNMRDCIERDRRAKKYRLHVRECVISHDVIREILSEPTTVKNKHIAAKYGISSGYVSKLRNGKAKVLLQPQIEIQKQEMAVSPAFLPTGS